MAGMSIAERLAAVLPDEPLEWKELVGQQFGIVRPDAVIPVLQVLKNQIGFDFLVDVTAVDYPQRPERFELIYILYSFASN